MKSYLQYQYLNKDKFFRLTEIISINEKFRLTIYNLQKISIFENIKIKIKYCVVGLDLQIYSTIKIQITKIIKEIFI